MIKNFGQNDPGTIEYAVNTFAPEDPVLQEIRERSNEKGLPKIHIGSMDALHLEVLTRAFNVKKAVEIGTLGGYSGVAIARGLLPGGKLYTFEYEQLHAEVAQQSFENAGMADRVELFQGAALDNLTKIEEFGPFDMVFIDADKVNYPNYLDWATKNLRVGGVVMGDNTFAWGMINQQEFDDPEVEASVNALRKFNEKVTQEDHYRATILPTGEGLTVAVKIK